MEGREMNDTTDDKKPPSKRQQRQAADAVQIYTMPPTSEDVVFLARELILCTLPHSDPGDVPAWSRTNGNLTLIIRVVPDVISIKISNIDRYFAKVPGKKYLPVLKNEPIYLIYMKSHWEQLYSSWLE
jgi:hypothetical protein